MKDYLQTFSVRIIFSHKLFLLNFSLLLLNFSHKLLFRNIFFQKYPSNVFQNIFLREHLDGAVSIDHYHQVHNS
jgi:hypothetical protein